MAISVASFHFAINIYRSILSCPGGDLCFIEYRGGNPRYLVMSSDGNLDVECLRTSPPHVPNVSRKSIRETTDIFIPYVRYDLVLYMRPFPHASHLLAPGRIPQAYAALWVAAALHRSFFDWPDQ